MNSIIRKRIFSIFISLVVIVSSAQELPPIVKYAPNTYNAGNQNWMIAQDKKQFVYFANNEGLLEFNGATWNLYNSPNETIIRSVKVVGDRVYTGCYMEFGYWSRESNNLLQYHSLTKKIKSKIVDDEQFWNILHYEQWIIFQSLNQIYIYDTKTEQFTILSPKNSILKAFQTTNSIYFQVVNEGLYEIENGKSKLISADPFFINNKIVDLFSNEDGLLLQTQANGLYRYENGVFSRFTTEVDAQISASSVYSAQKLSDGGYAIGTISNGIFILSNNGTLRYHITQNKGLSNNTALSLFEDTDQNLWIGLDNGINCINLQSPVRSFSDDTGILGTVYTSLLHNSILYVGTNQGLFYKKFNGTDSFQFVRGTKGQVWSIFAFEGTLFCGHDSGTFVIDNGIATPVFNASGTWKFETLAGRKDLLLQGNYYGISVLQKVNNQWKFRNKITGFDYSSKYFEVTKSKEVYVSHEYKGVFRFQLDPNFQQAKHVYAYKSPTKGKHAGLKSFNNTIYYAYKEGVFKLNESTKTFEKDSLLSLVFENDEYSSGKLIVDSSNKLWLFTKNYVHYFTLSKLSNQLKDNSIPIPASLRNSMLGYENITQLTHSLYLIGTTDGYYTININDLSFKNYSVSISGVTINKLDEKLKNCSIEAAGSFEYDENNITIQFTVPEYNKYINAEFQYKLDGLQEEWTEWSSRTFANFKNLPPGNYTFQVRAKIANSKPENIAIYRFEVLKPWYLTTVALFIYMILGIILALYIHRTYKKYYKEKEQKLIEENNLLLEIAALESEQQLMKIKNEQLSLDVDSKNKELAVSTMSLIKKNELLTLIKEDLKKTAEDQTNKSIKSVITTINKNISDEDTWTVFREAFDNADKDFLKKVKQAHPSLTPNDLRLCAYLRLNLSSKEIAPLLNISVRSVEIKRYRLRKKMDLPHEKGLVEYILAF